MMRARFAAGDLGAGDQGGRIEVALQADAGQGLARPRQRHAAVEAEAVDRHRHGELLVHDAGAARERDDRHLRDSAP